MYPFGLKATVDQAVTVVCEKQGHDFGSYWLLARRSSME